MREFKGQCIGVVLEGRGPDDPHIMVGLEIEDDGFWHRKTTVSSAWLDEMIEVLQAARAYVRAQEPDIYNGRQYGWKFKQARPARCPTSSSTTRRTR